MGDRFTSFLSPSLNCIPQHMSQSIQRRGIMALDLTQGSKYRAGLRQPWRSTDTRVRSVELSSDTLWGQILRQFTFSAVTACNVWQETAQFLEVLPSLFTGYTNQSVNAAYGNNRCLFSDPHRTHKYSLCGQNVELLNVKLPVHIVTTGLIIGKFTLAIP